jgi:hypothetical protein
MQIDVDLQRTIADEQATPRRPAAHASRRDRSREDILPALGPIQGGKSQGCSASPVQTLYDILDEKKPVTVNMAFRLGKAVGDRPRIWLAMQQVT